MTATHPGDGKVAVYRWFENGEGWAFHPWFGSRGLDLSRALDSILKGGVAGGFCVPGLGGWLVGEQCDDDLCPDRKARDRRPTILRAAFLSRRPVAGDHGRVLQALRDLPLPTQRQVDEDLFLASDLVGELAFDAEAPAGVAHVGANDADGADKISRRRRLVLAIALAVLVIGALLGVFAARHYQNWVAREDAPPPPPEPIRTPRPTPSPTPVVTEPGVRLETLTAGRFRQVLGEYARVDHPYPAYLKAMSERLPETASVYQDRRQLRTLLPDLLREVSTDAAIASDEGLVDVIAAELQYERWREGQGKREYRDADKPLPEELRRFVEGFRRPSAGLVRAAVAMAELLQAWGEREPSPRYAGQHPLATIDRFFAFLTRPRFVPRPLTFDHPAVVFLWRLPADPIGEGLTYEREEDLARTLRQLLIQLDPRFNPRDEAEASAGLLGRIGEAMRYDAWQRGDGRRTYVDDGKDPGSEVNAFVRRFAAQHQSP